MGKWVERVRNRVGECHICVVGTRADLVRKHPSRLAVSATDIDELKRELARLRLPTTADFFETSFDDGDDVYTVNSIVAVVAQRAQMLALNESRLHRLQ